MPHAVIETRREYSEPEESALIEAIHGALVRAFRIPPSDRHIRLISHQPHRFACPPGKAQPERYTLVSIDAFAGRSVDAKRALYREIVEALEPLGIPRDHVSVVLRDVPTGNWGVRGGQAACDVELGFEIEV